MTTQQQQPSKIIHYYRQTEPSHSLLPSIREELKDLGFTHDDDSTQTIEAIETESCFNVLLDSYVQKLSDEQTTKLEWLLAETFERNALSLEKSAFSTSDNNNSKHWILEFGPRLTFTSAFSSNAVSICQACDLPIARLELSQRYRFHLTGDLMQKARAAIKGLLHDRMTQQEYIEPLQSLDSGAEAKPVRTIPILKEGRAALERINGEMGLGFDDFDLDYYTQLFKVRRHDTVLYSKFLLKASSPLPNTRGFSLSHLTV